MFHNPVAPIAGAKFDLSLVIGRFQSGPHYGHLSLFEKAKSVSNHQLILVGSSFRARDVRNPFTFDERAAMIGSVTDGAFVAPLRDNLYNDQVWIEGVQKRVRLCLDELGLNPATATVALVGHHKDKTSYYLDLFPNYSQVEAPLEGHLNATDIRETFFRNGGLFKDELPDSVRTYLTDWALKNPEIYKNLSAELKYFTDYRKQFSALPYPPTFTTVDACVICFGHILFVRRRSHPGKGLWALPGGFLNQNERIIDGIFRELVEETKIDVPENVLRASLKGFPRVFDHPLRSLRGRTITHAGLIVLDGLDKLPKVKGADDAEKAKWIPLADFNEFYSEMMFEDHYDMTTYLTGRAS